MNKARAVELTNQLHKNADQLRKLNRYVCTRYARSVAGDGEYTSSVLTNSTLNKKAWAAWKKHISQLADKGRDHESPN